MKLAIVLATSILSFTALDARAATPADDAYSVTVQFADLDLNRQAGIATLYLRIKGAARRVCDQQVSDLLARRIYPVCVKRAVSEAVAHINHPMLTDYVAQLGGKPAKTAPISVAAR